MSQYDNLKVANIRQMLQSKGIIVKKIGKPFLIEFLNYVENGNVQVNPSLVENYFMSQTDELNLRIKELESELHDRTIHLNRTLDNSESYKSIVLESEEMFSKTIKEQSEKLEQQAKIIDKLNRQLSEISDLDKTCESCSESLEKISKLSREIEIKILEATSYKSETIILKDKISDLTLMLNEMKHPSSNKSSPDFNRPTQADVRVNQEKPSCSKTNAAISTKFPISSAAVNKRKVLLASDSQGRNCGAILSEIFDRDLFQTLCFTKPNADFENIAENAYRLSQGYTKQDYVVLLAGSNNGSRRNFISKQFLEDFRQKISHTNLILILTPFWNGNIRHNSTILQNNIILSSTFQNTALVLDTGSILSSFHYTNHGLHFNHPGKVKLITTVRNAIIHQITSQKDLFR